MWQITFNNMENNAQSYTRIAVYFDPTLMYWWGLRGQITLGAMPAVA